MLKMMSLEPAYVLTRPYTLDYGKEYYLQIRQDNGTYPTYLPVKFVNYDPCPAIVFVSNGDEQLFRVPREDIYIAEATVFN